MEFRVGYVCLGPGDVPVVRTVEVTEDILVDLDADGRITGIETLGNANWQDGLIALAMQGRLAVTERKRKNADDR